MPSFSLLRERLAGRRPVRARGLPLWAQCPQNITVGEMTQQRELSTLSGDQSDLLKQIFSAWERGDFNALNRWLQECTTYFDPSKPHLLAYFVGLGGIDLFVTLLCDVNAPTHSSKALMHSFASNSKTRSPWQLIAVMASLLRVLTELLVCHNELGWYYYDNYPGIFFRLLEFAMVPDLQLAALVMLEHLVLSVGPVLEISKVPILQELIRTNDNAALAILCRVIALLIVPGVVLNQREPPYQRLVFPESLLPLQRIQRVIDSNVLWLIGEKNLVKRLVMLCEVRETNDSRDAAQTLGALGVVEVPVVEPSMREWVTTAVAAMPLLTGAINTVPGDPSIWRELNQVGSGLTRVMGRSNSTDVANHAVGRGVRNYRDEGPVGDPDDVSLQQMFGSIASIWVEDDALSATSAAAVGLSVDFSWFVGSVDAKQRWRLRDLTLREEVDDNRPLLCGFGPVTEKRAREAFQKQNQAFLRFINCTPQFPRASHVRRVIVGAQSEILFVLNLILSTFFFGDVWHTLRECQWIKTASNFFDTAFEPRAAHYSLSPYLEQLRQVPGLRQLPRFLPSGGGSGATETGEVMVEKSERVPAKHRNAIPGGGHEGGSCDSDADDDDDKDKGAVSHPAMRFGEDTEAYITHGGHLWISDNDDRFDDKNHEHEPNTIRKLELLRGVQEFWNSQDRCECSMLHEGDTAEQSTPLAMKIALMLAERSEDSCVETSACHALEGYLRCFSFPVSAKSEANTPQTLVGSVLVSSILEHRVYNATYMPGLSGSLSPTKRIDSFFALLGELIRYHHKNLVILRDYVVGSVSLSHLNNPSATSSTHVRQLHVASEAMEQLLRLPPLDREEHEPFAKVLWRRICRHGCDTNLFVRSLLLSLTPGLRSKINYMWKPVTASTVDARESLKGVARVGDVVTGHPKRLSYIGKKSRWFVALLSEIRKTTRESTTVETETTTSDAFLSQSSFSALSLWDMLQILLSSPHRLPLEQRPFPRFFDEQDRALVMGEIDLPPIGPPPHLAVPLFPEMADTENNGLDSFVGLEKALLCEPHRLVYNMLGPLNAEHIQNAGRLCVVTTSLLVFVRAARLGGPSAVHDVLEKLKPLAILSYEKWKKQRDAPIRCAKVRSRRGKGGRGICSGRASGEGSCFCAADDGSTRCLAFRVHGHCSPPSANEEYYRRYGGCFFRNMFRLMCVWVGHYGASQRYVETLYYCTEVPFAESKCIALYLMRVIPDYFL